VRRALPLLGALVLLAGCGTGGKAPSTADPANGKKLFLSSNAQCAACHVLADAGSKGTVGPNLDDAFAGDRAQGFKESRIENVVLDQIREANPPMPKNLVSGAKRRDVAAYVAATAAKPGKDTGLLASAVAAPGAGKPAVEKAGKLSIAANAAGQLAYETNKAAATAGPVTVEMPNMSGVGHNLALETGEGAATPKGTKIGATPIISKGVAKVSVTLKPGTYTFFCEVPGHRQAGMYGTLTVK